jgi:hypothetical protein
MSSIGRQIAFLSVIFSVVFFVLLYPIMNWYSSHSLNGSTLPWCSADELRITQERVKQYEEPLKSYWYVNPYEKDTETLNNAIDVWKQAKERWMREKVPQCTDSFKLWIYELIFMQTVISDYECNVVAQSEYACYMYYDVNDMARKRVTNILAY